MLDLSRDVQGYDFPAFKTANDPMSVTVKKSWGFSSRKCQKSEKELIIPAFLAVFPKVSISKNPIKTTL